MRFYLLSMSKSKVFYAFFDNIRWILIVWCVVVSKYGSDYAHCSEMVLFPCIYTLLLF